MKKSIGNRLMAAAETAANRVNAPMVDRFLRRGLQRKPDRTPAEVIQTLERMYLASVAAQGVVAGGSAALGPEVGIPAALLELVANFETTLVFVMACAKVHGIELETAERRLTLLMGIMAGDLGPAATTAVAGRTGTHWGKLLVADVPISSIRAINKKLGPHFVTKLSSKGVVQLGKAIPLGIGAGIGGIGNFVFGRIAISSARRALGPAPTTFPPQLQTIVDEADIALPAQRPSDGERRSESSENVGDFACPRAMMAFKLSDEAPVWELTLARTGSGELGLVWNFDDDTRASVARMLPPIQARWTGESWSSVEFDRIGDFPSLDLTNVSYAAIPGDVPCEDVEIRSSR